MDFTLADIAAALNAEVLGDGSLPITGAAEPGEAGPTDLAMAMDAKYAEALSDGQARAALLWDGADWQALGLEGAITLARGKAAMPAITRMMDAGPDLAPGIHPSAVIDPSAAIGDGAAIGPFVVIGPSVVIGARARLLPHSSVGRGSVIGDDLTLHAGARVTHECRIGHRFMGHPNSVVGGDGFSFTTTETKSAVEALREDVNEGGEVQGSDHWARVHSLGGVEIGDDVELGSCSTIDRGTIRATRIGRGTKIDNQVQIGHNVLLGEDCLVCGQAGVAGSARIGNRVVLAGRVAVSDNIFIGDDVIAGGGAGIMTNVPAGRAVLGTPAVKMDTQLKINREMRRLPRLADTIRELQKAVSKLGDSD
ncbi:UDP-3-O-(3-hydroxymyristoyl)glucosamine N-acyltransferase [Aliiroseovarius subalbicans]|uniref:UDP-3-O-(3-hydroxymyristoyl)glucosamine N-acyltransferase n=1 Tax=Aliiroseovarius subalbicans TaxID=2925840 RepID=UPI001F576081|nr:UDP-3-O-(3-hydroxymyristoyl)glucosamine N-acyltransferase [Aliiroseovarius subalbicans]MCI2398262.1 UDP-3-O-(3-hydroxymyristoyl)glucosamine N-acyltransferase [Aliiroseovarius subalbicans]